MRERLHSPKRWGLRLFAAARPVTGPSLWRDGLAGLSLAAMSIPQLLGYAQIAGMPLVTGLYTALLAPLAFALLGSSRHLVVAADSATAAILAGSITAMAAPASSSYVGLVTMVTVMTAVLLLVARLLKLGFLADFLSRTVLTGFLAGVGLQVGTAMLAEMLKIHAPSRDTVLQAWQILRALPTLSLPSLLLSVLVLIVIVIGRRLSPRAPIALLLLVLAILASRWLNLAHHGFAVLGALKGGLPGLRWPSLAWDKLPMLLPISAACVIVILAQSAATARAFAERYKEKVDENADILGLAAANALTALGGGFIANGSPTQTAVADRAGARSQAAQLVFAVVVLLTLVFLVGWLKYLPRCVLAAIIFAIAVGLIDIKTLRAMRRESPGEWWLALTTAAAVAGLGVEQGMVLSALLSLLRHVRQSYHPHSALLKHGEEGGWQEEPAEPGQQSAPGVIIYRFNADLFYANAARFTEEVRGIIDGAPEPVRFLVIEADAIPHVDYSAARTLEGLLSDLKARGVATLFARVGPTLRADLTRHGLLGVIGEDHVFATRHNALRLVRERRQADPASSPGAAVRWERS